MFSLGVRDPFGCRGVKCVKLPAAVAFPTDGQLLQRLEELRRALPPNSVKSLLKTASRATPPQPVCIDELSARREAQSARMSSASAA